MEQLKILFEKAKIKYIVNVDDCYGTDIVPDKFTIAQYLNNNIDTAYLFFSEIGKVSFKDTVDSLDDERYDYIEALCNDLTDESIRAFTQKYYGNVDVEKNALEQFCQELKDDGIIIEYKKFSSKSEATNFYGNMGDCLNVNANNRVLWMIDKDFQRTNGSPEDGLNLISDFISRNNPYNVYALTSAQVEELNNTSFRELLTNDASETLLACIIHKHNIIDKNYQELYKQMYFGFRENYSGTIIEQLNFNLESSAKAAGDIIKSLGDETIYKVFLAGSKAEGVAPLDTFQRLLMIILKKDIAQKICDNYDIISRLIYDYSSLCSWCYTKEDTEQDFKKVEDMRRSECFDDTINRMYSPVSYGDVFLINNSEYLLVAQSCNIMLRKEGVRKAQCATLVQIEESNNGDDSHYILEYFKDNNRHCVSYNNIINVDFSVLDLCCLNENGKLTLADDFSLETVSYRYSDGLNILLKKTIEHNRTLIENYNILKSKRDELSLDKVFDMVRKIYKDNSTELTASFEEGIEFNGKRICRLNQNITDDICKRYAEYHSRKGLDYDFAQQYKIYEFEVNYNFDFSLLNLDSIEVHRFLLRSYKYYLSKELENDKLKSEVNVEFSQKYCMDIFHTESKSNIAKVDLKNKTITLDASYIPVKINNQIVKDVLCYKDNIFSIKVPKELLGEILVTKIQGTYPNKETFPNLKIANNQATFSFNVGQSLVFNDNVHVSRELKFKFNLQEGIVLEIIS